MQIGPATTRGRRRKWSETGLICRVPTRTGRYATESARSTISGRGTPQLSLRLTARMRTSLDLVSETNLSVRQDVGPQSAPMHQTRDYGGPRQSLTVHTWPA